MTEYLKHIDPNTVKSGENAVEVDIDFDTEATVAFRISRNNSGEFIHHDTGESAHEFARNFSLMKHGSLEGVRYLGRHLALAAISDAKFISFLKSAETEVYICSPGIYNVPSASNLLLRDVASRLNAYFSYNKLPTLIVKDLTRVGESSLDYATQAVGDRGLFKSSETLMPKEFEGASVIYLDDIYITGTVLRRNKDRLRVEARVESSYFLVGAFMDQDVVVSSNGRIEDDLNKHAVDGSLNGGILEVLSGEFIPVQKTLKVVLHPDNFEDLILSFPSKFNDERLIEIFRLIYTAACANDFWNRYDGKFVPALKHIRKILMDKRELNNEGVLVN